MRNISFYKKYHIISIGIVLVFVIFTGYAIRVYSMRNLVLPQVEPPISVYPSTILPGDPVFITVNATSSVEKIFLDTKSLPIFTYGGKSRAAVGIPFEEKVLNRTIRVTLTRGETLTTQLVITPREKIEKPVGIPEKLGGNTTEASKTLISNLARENGELNATPTETTQLWTSRFMPPLVTIFVTDNYGYDRKTVDRTIIHKGTDFRAAVGTDVKAMNAGKIVLARKFIVYGNTVIVDHGLGIQTLYMHLSKISVKEGDIVKAGQVIGLTGMTGYATAAHLHVSVKVGGVSIDPMTFLGFFTP